MNPGAGRRGFTLIELLVVIAIIAVLIALLLPAVLKTQEAANFAKCQNNLKNLALAVRHFEASYGLLPTYNGIFPAKDGKTTQAANAQAVYGSWFVHLLPFIEQQNMYEAIAEDVGRFGNTGSTVTAPGGALITPAKAAAYDNTGVKWVPASYSQYTGSLQYVATTAGNGYTIMTQEWVPPRVPDPGTNQYVPHNPVLISPAVAAVYGPPGAPVKGYVGVWKPETRELTFPVLQCPSDPSTNTPGLVYKSSTDPGWGSTNYLANWNVFSDGDATKGYTAPPGKTTRITDGLSNTVLFAEGYAWCEKRGRTALLAWHSGGGGVNYGGVHNFGLTYALSNAKFTVDNGPTITISKSNGFPNPSLDPAVNMMFQIKPHPTQTGLGGCNSLTAQTPHAALPVALADGSVRIVDPGISPATWLAVMLPNEGNVPGSDW